MKNLVILGAGTAGTMIANKLRRSLPSSWSITIVDRDDAHHYQPGYLFVPFGQLRGDQVVKVRRSFIPDGVSFRLADIDRVDAQARTVHLGDGTHLPYDLLVIATGTTPRPDQTPGMAEAMGGSVHEFYTLAGAEALREALAGFTGGRLVVQICELPIKCPVAPLEFAFLADAHLAQRGLRDRVQITYVTPLDGAFTKPVASAQLGHMLAERDIALEADFMIERVDTEGVDGAAGRIVSFDEREIPFDLLVTVPVNMGADFIAASGLGDELNYVPVDKHTFQSPTHPEIFALGDASNIPTSKAGSVAHFAVEVFVDNLLQHVAGAPMTHGFDGHANCFVESGRGKGLLLDFNYDTQPLTGTFPLAKVGPLHLLKESRVNHLGKLAFRHVYWTMLLPGRPLPLKSAMSMTGKIQPDPAPGSLINA